MEFNHSKCQVIHVTIKETSYPYAVQGFFFNNFIADIDLYSQLKIMSFFPIYRGKFPTDSYKIKKNE